MNPTITTLTPAAVGPAPAAAPAPAFDGALPQAGLAPVPGFAQWLEELAAALPEQPLIAPQAAVGERVPADDEHATADADDLQSAPAVAPPALPDLSALAAMAIPLAAAINAVLEPLPRAAAAGDGAAAAAPEMSPAASGAPVLVPAAGLAQAKADGNAPAAEHHAAAEHRAAADPAIPAAGAAGWGVAPPAADATPAPPLALSGPAPAWRQTLHEALGERLRIQLGNQVEQAVIRLEPPALGRVDIAIRYSAGTLQVALSATHADVVRQLNSVSDSLRNDLAGRQYAEVTVSVSQAAAPARAQHGGFAEQQQRQRQDDRREQAAPGMALADAGGKHAFSLNGRE